MDFDLVDVLEPSLAVFCLILLLDPNLPVLVKLAREEDHVGWLHLQVIARPKGMDQSLLPFNVCHFVILLFAKY